MDNRDTAVRIALILDQKKTEDIDVIDIGEKSGFADYLIIGTARNMRQLGALSHELEDKLAEDGVLVHHIEGKNDSGWVLMDYGDIIVNLLTKEQREHYQIERVWNDCIRLDIDYPQKDEQGGAL
ncbi:MAG: ribosome silencing factor [Firmicutes bacterium]|nr:ribosome silencing factor [Bacillota bacterium]